MFRSAYISRIFRIAIKKSCIHRRGMCQRPNDESNNIERIPEFRLQIFKTQGWLEMVGASGSCWSVTNEEWKFLARIIPGRPSTSLTRYHYHPPTMLIRLYFTCVHSPSASHRRVPRVLVVPDTQGLVESLVVIARNAK